MNLLNLKKAAAGIMSLALIIGTSGYMPSPARANAASGSVTINEVCAKNTSYNIKGGLYDWVELYNSSSSAVDISGWGLSDKASKPYKYTFPDGTSIPAGGRLMIACDSDAAASDPSIAPFGLSTSGETLTLTDKNGNAADTITFESLAADASYGQYPDGSGEYFTLAVTPSSPNSAPQGANAVRLPGFSKESGFYSSEFSLTLTAPEGCTVYYTTDGSDPTTSSEKYAAPIRIADCSSNPNVYSARTDISASQVTAPKDLVDKAAIIRAVAVDAQGRVSDIVTKTYFVGSTDTSYYKNMKVVSLVTDPDNLFDYEKGIYVKGKIYDDKYGQSQNPQDPDDPGQPGFPGFPGFPGGGGGGWGMVNTWEMEANYTQHGKDWERPASFELFENGQSVLTQDVGIRIKGAASRSYAQKSFNVYTRADYGKPEFEYDFFDGKATKQKNGKSIKKFDGITLRNGGNDNSYTFFRDSINQSLVSDRAMATQTTSECLVFLDGEFWGIYQIIEKVSDDYLSSHYGINKSDAVIIKNGEVEEGDASDLENWQQLAKYCASTDLTNSEAYGRVCQQLDIQSYIDYFAAQIYWNNTDWPQNNFAAWKTAVTDSENPFADGKWRMFLFDTELSSGMYGNDAAVDRNSFDRISRNTDDESRMFISLMKNEEFREQFNLTLMDLANENFSDKHVTEKINFYDSTYHQQIVDTLERFHSGSGSFFGGGGNTESTYNNELNTLTSFYSQRFSRLMQHMQRSTGITGQANTLTVKNDISSGEISLNTLKLADKYSTWSGKYFSDQTVHITAQPKEGKTFDHWEVSGVTLSSAQLSSPSIEFKPESDVTVTAVYKGGSSVLLGDYNGDGTVDTADIVTLSNYLKGKVRTHADTDMNGDGRTTVYDLILLKRKLFQK
ncbi:MAG: CotH kinase family protein [Ruminococcus sp.]|nr:CotH kinase family protein [Ruminococcus sp.]